MKYLYSKIINIDNLASLELFAKKLNNKLVNGDTVLLTGDLGAGKTTLVKFIAKENNVKDKVISPTFNIMKIYLKIDDDIITDAKFETFGCGSAIASSSMATELIKGKPVSEALALTNKAVVEALDGLPTHKIHCSVLAEEAIKKALQNYYEKNGIEYERSKLPECESCGHCRETE